MHLWAAHTSETTFQTIFANVDGPITISNYNNIRSNASMVAFSDGHLYMHEDSYA